MGTIVDATVATANFALAETFSAEPDVAFRTVGLVADGSTGTMPFLWADHEDPERLTAVMRRDESVADVEQVTTVEGSCLLRIEWVAQLRAFAATLSSVEASVLEASGYDGRWHLQLFFPNHDTAAESREFLETAGSDPTVSDVTCLSETGAYGSYGITERQYQTVI
jgi:hypothetical protein